MSRPDLLTEAIAAHGGEERWEQVEELTLHLRSGGFAPASKGRRRDVAAVQARVSTRRPRTVFADYGGSGRQGVFTGERVWIEEDGEVVAERRDPREAFPYGRRALWWDRLDLLYFAGYALWGYACTPFLLAHPGCEAREVEPWEEDGQTLRRLAVTFPEGLPVHSREQVFYFDRRGLLRRNDYTAEVFGGWARGAHHCEEHREFGGLVFPTRRRVYPRARTNRPRRFPTLVRIDLDRVELSDAPG